MLKLYILRHGKAVKPDNSRKDFDRKLSTKGVAQINQVGFILKQDGVKIDQLIASSARRTDETAEIMTNYLKVDQTYYDEALYLTDLETLLKYVRERGNGNSVLLVGHNFGLSDFANYLLGDYRTLSTGMLVEINFNFEDWSKVKANSGTLGRIIEPKVHTV